MEAQPAVAAGPAMAQTPLLPASNDGSNMALTTYNPVTKALTTATPPPAAPLASPPPANIDVLDAWSAITKSLMSAVIESQPSPTAAVTLFSIFRPAVEGLAAARKEGKRWKERADAYMVEHQTHKSELAQSHESLQTQVSDLENKLEESRRKVRELESNNASLESTVSVLEKRVTKAEAEAVSAKGAHAKEAQERTKEAEALAKTAQDAKMRHDKLREETDNKARAQAIEITKLLDKVKENEAIKTKLEERLRTSMSKNTSLEEEVAQKAQEISSLQSRVTELTTRKETLERQLALYQRIPTRRF